MSTVRSSVEGHVGWVTIDRPEKLNALDGATNTALRDALADMDARHEVRVVVLSGAGGRAFCAGADLAGLTGDVESWDNGISFGGGLTGLGGIHQPLAKPVIASVTGWAIGGGLELALACDLIVAAESARFSIPEAQAGVLGYSLVAHRAIRQFPRAIAIEMLYAGRVVGAAEALGWGAVNRVVPDDQAEAATRELAESVAAASPLALRATKAVLSEADGRPLMDAVGATYRPVEEYLDSADHAEALRAILARDRPEWTGR